MKRAIGVLVLVALLMCTTNVEAKLALNEENTQDYLYKIAYFEQSNVTNPSYGSIGGEWAVMALARYGAITDEFIEKYKSNLKSHLDSCKGELSDKKYSEYARVVIALTSIEENPENFGGYNLLRPLSEYDNIVKQGLNGVIYTLIALDCGDYEILEPESNYNGAKTSREKLKKTILSNQKADGGWSFAGKISDADMTAMAIQALAPYYNHDYDVKSAIDKGINRLGEMQQKDGGYKTGDVSNCESTAQVLTALSVMKIDINDSRFIKNNKTVLDGLMQYYKGGGFCHWSQGDANLMATEQAMYALTAYYRSISNLNGLYEMSDGILKKKIDIKHVTSNNEQENTKKDIDAGKHKKKSQKTKEETTVNKKEKINKTDNNQEFLESLPKQGGEETVITVKDAIQETETRIETLKNGETSIVIVKKEEQQTETNTDEGWSDAQTDNRSYIIEGVIALVIILAGAAVYAVADKKERFIIGR